MSEYSLNFEALKGLALPEPIPVDTTVATTSQPNESIAKNMFGGVELPTLGWVGVGVVAIAGALAIIKNKKDNWSDFLNDKPYK